MGRSLTWTIGSLAVFALHADRLDTIGVRVLRQVDPTLLGSGVPVAQVEATDTTNSPPTFEVNPAAVGQPTNLFSYTSDLGTATNYPNSVGAESGHADSVGAAYYGANGVAPQISHVDNYEANHFYNSIISPLTFIPPAIAARIVNQSFVFDGLTPAERATAEQDYDNYAANHNTLFISGAGNSGQIIPVATCFNGIGVAVVDGSTSVGPTADGRSKPDLTAPGGATSFSTPYVSGAAAVLLQAATRGDGGSSTATNALTLKTLLINGAVKPADWTNGPATPLDGRYGAGIVNVFNSWKQLSGGKHAFIETSSPPTGGAHPPGANPNNVAALTGWDFNSLTSTAGQTDRVNHYYFNLPASTTGTVTLTATLVWNRAAALSPLQMTVINNLNLFLYNAATGNLVLASTSAVDNVEHLFVPALPAGRYDLQVLKSSANQATTAETYTLAFEFFTLPLNLALTDTNIVLSWPVAPTGFRLESTASFTPPIVWSNVNAAVAISNNLNHVTLPAPDAQLFFRLKRP